MDKSLSALSGMKTPEAPSGAAITLEDVFPFSLHQIAAWPDTVAKAGAVAAKQAGCASAPDPGHAMIGSASALLRVEPLKWWLISPDSDVAPPKIADTQGAALDLSHSRTWIRVSGDKSETLLNHFLPLDLRDGAFPPGSVASTAFHHVGITLWREEAGYSLLVPRSFAVSLWELLVETATQYGIAVK